jgi:hypothetical protein
MTLRILRNLTLHAQGDVERAIAAERGFDLLAEPEGISVEPGPEGLAAAVESLVAVLKDCGERGHAALVGGHTGLWLAAVLCARDRNILLPSLFYFDTRRIQDENGRFVFQAERLVGVRPEETAA